MTTDEELITLINRLREPAARAFHYEYAANQNRPKDVQAVWEVAKPLKAAMDGHPEFAEPFSKFFLGKQIAFFNSHQSINVLRVAQHKGGVEALAWYRRVITTNCARMRVVGHVHGLLVERRHLFSNNVTLLPVLELPDSPNSLYLKQPQAPRPGMEFPAAVMVELQNIESEPSDVGHKRSPEISEKMRKTIAAFVLSDDAAPTLAETWQEFADPELAFAEHGVVWMSSRHEGRLPSHPANVTDEMLNWVETYLSLSPDVANACEIPIARLNLARRRIAPGDKAIDGSVCLEALLSGRGRGELTHRLSVRAALLLGRSLDERQKIAEDSRKFYKLRSDVVHGSSSKKDAADHEIAREGLLLCLAVLRSVVTSAQVPEPELWELTGGPAWNRYVNPKA
jgi:hypothetical protein